MDRSVPGCQRRSHAGECTAWRVEGGGRSLDVGRWTLVVGRWSLVVGRWSLVVGRWTLDVGRWTLDVGRWTLDVGRWTLDVGRWTLDVGKSVLVTECVFRPTYQRPSTINQPRLLACSPPDSSPLPGEAHGV